MGSSSVHAWPYTPKIPLTAAYVRQPRRGPANPTTPRDTDQPEYAVTDLQAGIADPSSSEHGIGRVQAPPR